MQKLLIFILIVTVVRVAGSNYPDAVQIIETKDGANGTRVLHYKADAIMSELLTSNDVKNLPILVYSVTGKTRGGKSFLLDLMYKYLNSEGQPSWTDGLVPNIFNFKDGADSLTKGLWLSTKIFPRTLKDGTKVGIMLMDSQGLFDGEVTSGESVAMSGVSTILSHVQMFNMKQKITTIDLEQIMLHLVPENVKDKPANQSSVGCSLMFLVRDFMGGKKYGFGLENGKQYIKIEQKRGTQEYQSMWNDQKSIFNRIDCLLLPHPGYEVITEEFSQSPNLQVVRNEFLSEVNTFLKEMFAPENLIPHKGGITGNTMHETLKNLDGKVADKSLSYYNMYIDRTNNLLMESAVASFTVKLENLQDIYKVKLYMDETLNAALFKGHSATSFTFNLKQTLQRTVNSKVRNNLIDKYNRAAEGNNIASCHSSVWSNILSVLELISGSEEEVRQRKEGIVKEMASVYYAKLATEEIAKFKNYLDTAAPQPFYDTMLNQSQPGSLNRFSDSVINRCDDFERTGARLPELETIRNNQKIQFETNAQINILKNMYKVKEYFIQRYSSQLTNNTTNNTVQSQNANIWPHYQGDINRLKFESENEKNVTTHAIVKEIATIYYKKFREEVYSRRKSEWNSLSNKDFLGIHKEYSDESKLRTQITEILPEYNEFRNHGLSDIWESEKEILLRFLQVVINGIYNDRNLGKPYIPSNWVVFRDTILRKLFG